MKTLTVASLFATSVLAQDWDYKSHGVNWGTIPDFKACNQAGGSPIDLKTNPKAYTSHEAEKDVLVGTFQNQVKTKVEWKDFSTNVALAAGSSFKSRLGKNLFEAHTEEWEAKNFMFKSKSEHTFNTKHFDLEFQTIFNAKPYDAGQTFKHAGISIMFSLQDYNVKLSKAEQVLIDTFFETLDWKSENPTDVNLLTFGDLMSVVDMKNRFIYKGSLTTPPCQAGVYWNVLQTVYPIKREHLDRFKAKLNADDKTPTGNYREVQDLAADHNVNVVTETTLGSDLDTANDINFNININVYNQNVGGCQ